MSTTRKQAFRQCVRGYSAGVFVVQVLFLLAAGGVVWVYNGMIAQ